MTGSNIWDQVLARIETKVNRHSFYTWFKPTAFVADRDGAIRVRVPNALFRDWLTKHYAAVIEEALAEVQRAGAPVAFVTEDVGAPLVPDVPQPEPDVEEEADGPPTISAFSARAIRSIPSSSDRRTSSRTRRAARWRKRRRAPTTRCSSTAAWAWARRT